jgi:hypothetical protein
MPHVEKHLANQVLRHALVMHDTHHEAKNSHMMPRLEHLHGELVATSNALDQALV